MILALLATIARASCEEPSAATWAELRASPLAIEGTVRDLDVVGSEIHHHVQVDRAWRGRVRSGWVVLVSPVAPGVSPLAPVYPVGKRLYAVGTPDGAGRILLQACSRATGRVEAGYLAEMAGRGGRFAGSAPPAPSGPVTPFPTAGAERVRLARADTIDLGGEAHAGTGAAEAVEGRLVTESGGRVHAIWELGEWEVAGTVDVADLAAAPVRAVALAPGVEVAAGARLERSGDGVTYAQDGVTVTGAVPPDALGHRWLPQPAPAVDVTRALALERDTAWSAAPGGPPVGTLVTTGGFLLTAAGDPAGGWMPVRIDAPGLVARGWLPQDAARPGLWLGPWSMRSQRFGAPVTIPAGAEAIATTAAVVFARATARATADELARFGDRAWVLVPTPWGPIPGEVVLAP